MWYRPENEASVFTPAILVYPDRIEENIRRMIDLAGHADRLRPHVKTHKIAEVIALQLQMGISRFKCATLSEMALVSSMGGQDVLLAYPLLGPAIQNFLQLTEHFPETKFSLTVDSLTACRELSEQARISGKVVNLFVDLDRAAEAARGLAQVAEVVGDQVRLDHVLAVGDIVRSGDTSDPESKAEIIVGATKEALDRLLVHREEEGRALGLDLFQRISYLRELKAQVEELAGSAPNRARKNITDYLQKIDLGGKIDPQRLEAEVALLAQRADVSEEITRLQSHLDSLEDQLKAGGTVGRRIDFILQEIQREVNTIGSKTGLAEISSLVVDFKSELEKIREQAQNI